jgi:REP element-mobilizing transposase RayT
MSHRVRPELDARLPLHVSLRMTTRTFSLRSGRAMRQVEASLRGGAHRFGVRIVQVSVQGNHLHCLVEAPDRVALSSAVKGLGVRLSRRMNSLMGKQGRVVADRYHARALRTPTEVKNAIHYLRHNHRHHHGAHYLPSAWVDPCSSDARDFGLPAPTTWLLRIGWQRGRISPARLAALHADDSFAHPRF